MNARLDVDVDAVPRLLTWAREMREAGGVNAAFNVNLRVTGDYSVTLTVQDANATRLCAIGMGDGETIVAAFMHALQELAERLRST